MWALCGCVSEIGCPFLVPCGLQRRDAAVAAIARGEAMLDNASAPIAAQGDLSLYEEVRGNGSGGSLAG